MRRNRSSDRDTAFALVTVFLFSGIILMMVLALFMSVRGRLFLSQTYRNQTAALYLAESGLWDAVSQLELDPSWTAGFHNKTLPGYDGSYSVVFNTSGGNYKATESVNNFDGGSPANYRGTNFVPNGCASLVVTANVGGYQREVEALVRIGGGLYPAQAPIVTSGRVDLRGSVSIDGRKGQTNPERVDANVHSNKSEAVPDIIVWDGAGEARIDGKLSVVAPNADAINVADGVALNGKEPGAVSQSIPDVNIKARVEGKRSAPPITVNPGVTTLVPPSASQNDLYHNGDLTVQGDLILEGVDLHIEGALHVNGSITGSGSVFVTGGTTLQGDSRIASATPETIALFSEGNVRLSGFSGTEYMESLAADNSQLAADWEQLSDSLRDYRIHLDHPGNALPATSLSQLNSLAAEIGGGQAGGVAPPPTLSSRRHNATQHLVDALAAQPASTARTRMMEKFEDLNALFFSYADGHQYELAALQALKAGRIERGGFDAAIDNFNSLTGAQKALVKGLIKGYVDTIDYEHLGSAYFQGIIFTHGSVYTDAEVTVQGAVVAFDNGSQDPTDINGETVQPGDLVLQPLTRISYIEEFFKPKDASGGVGAAGVQLLLWMGR